MWIRTVDGDWLNADQLDQIGIRLSGDAFYVYAAIRQLPARRLTPYGSREEAGAWLAALMRELRARDGAVDPQATITAGDPVVAGLSNL